MSDNDKRIVPTNGISSKGFLTKVEAVARNGAIKGSKGRKGISSFGRFINLKVINVCSIS